MIELVNDDHPILAAVMPTATDELNLEALSKDMFLLMWSSGGIGMAAPQVGLAVRMFVMGPQSGPNFVCINPEIVEHGPDVMNLEGCLSFPGLWLNIKRPEWVHARYRTLNGETVEQRFDGLLARCYIHELDHLNGVTFVSKAKPLSLRLAKERQRKELRKQKRVL